MSVLTKAALGRALHWAEVDANFTGLDGADLAEASTRAAADAAETAARIAADALLIPLSQRDTDVTLAANSDSKIATQKATKAYVDAQIPAQIAALDVEVFKGPLDCSANPNYPAASAGHVYRVSVAGKVGGASGPNVEIGDRLECFVDSTASGNHATVGASWFITQVNIDGAVIGPSSATDGHFTLFDGSTGKLLKDGGAPSAVATSGSASDIGTGTLPAGRLPALTGDVTSSAGSAATTLANTAVTPGSYTNSNLTVDAKGRVTAASNGVGATVSPSICNGRLTLAPGFPVYAPTNAIAASGQDTSAETVTLTAHGWVTGTMVVSSATSGGLTAGTQYYLSVASANAVSFHTTVAAAEAGTSKVDITGTVTATITASGISRTSILWTPYKGAQIALYNGSSWDVISFSETPLAFGTLTASLPYDVYTHNNSGTLALELLAWASDTARATALVLQDGVLCKSGAHTRRYIGTIRTNSTTTTIDDGGMLITNVGGKRFVWNYDNRVDRGLGVIETAAASSYTTQTWRVARANAGNIVEFVIGVAEDAVDASIVGGADTRSSTAAGPRIAVGVDSATVPSITQAGFYNNTSSAIVGGMTATYNSRGPLTAGYHYLAWLERGGQGTSTFTYLDVTGQAGMVARIRG